MTQLWTPPSRARTPAVDDELRYLLELIVEQHGPITVRLNDEERVPGRIRWEKASTPGGALEATVWFEPG